MTKNTEPIRVMFYNDGFHSTSGYGRVTKELSTRLAKDPNYEVFSLNIVDRRPLTVVDNVTLCPTFGVRENPKKSGYLSSVVNTISFVKPHVFIPICDAFFLDRDGLNDINFGDFVKYMPYVPVDSNNLGKGSKATFDKADRILVQSEFGKQEIKKGGYESYVFRHGINQEKFKPDSKRRKTIRQRFGIMDDEKVFLFIGRNNKRKRIERLIRGFALFVKNNPDAKVKLILHGSKYDDFANNIYERIETEEELYNVDIYDKIFFPYKDHMLGHGVDEEKIIDLYHAADWTVSMASGGGTELLSYEGFAMGLPTIYPKNSMWEEMLGVTVSDNNLCERGFSVESTEDVFVGLGCTQPLPSYNSLAKTLETVYNLDDKTYNSLSNNCLKKIKEEANWDIIVDELKGHIKKVIKK